MALPFSFIPPMRDSRNYLVNSRTVLKCYLWVCKEARWTRGFRRRLNLPQPHDTNPSIIFIAHFEFTNYLQHSTITSCTWNSIIVDDTYYPPPPLFSSLSLPSLLSLLLGDNIKNFRFFSQSIHTNK